MDADIASLKINYLQNNYTITSVSSLTKEDIRNSNYVELNGGVVLDKDIQIQEFSQELRLNTDINEELTILFGAFFSNKFQFDYDDKNTLRAAPLVRNWDLQLPDNSYALFSQLTYWFSNDISVTTGLRYEKTKREFKRHFTAFDGSTSYADVSSTWTQILPKLALSYYLDDNSQVYLSYAEGYRPGGYNYRSLGSSPLPYKEQSTQSYELGYKNGISNTIFISGALFYNFIDDLRIVTFADDLSTTVKNADKAQAYGVEFAISYKPDTKLYLFSNFGFTYGKMKEFSGSDAQYNNNKIVDVPDITASIGGKYNFTSHLYFQSNIRYVGERYYDISNTTKESGYEVINIGLGYEKNGYTTCSMQIMFFNKSILTI